MGLEEKQFRNIDMVLLCLIGWIITSSNGYRPTIFSWFLLLCGTLFYIIYLIEDFIPYIEMVINKKRSV
jgi:hypothetical protein